MCLMIIFLRVIKKDLKFLRKQWMLYLNLLPYYYFISIIKLMMDLKFLRKLYSKYLSLIHSYQFKYLLMSNTYQKFIQNVYQKFYYMVQNSLLFMQKKDNQINSKKVKKMKYQIVIYFIIRILLWMSLYANIYFLILCLVLNQNIIPNHNFKYNLVMYLSQKFYYIQLIRYLHSKL